MTPDSRGIRPAEPAFDAEGTPWSATYDDVYHPGAGGLAQARHVFLGGNGLPLAWRDRRSFTILETGFGLGLNFLATWEAFRSVPGHCRALHFLSVEKHPFRSADLALLHDRLLAEAGGPERAALGALAARLRSVWPELTPGFHRIEFTDPADGVDRRVTLTLAFGDAIACLPQFVAEPDAVFLDGFAPAKNPELWSPALLREIALLGRPGTTVATWSVATAVREGLAGAGFACEKRPGIGHKREILAGRLEGPAEGRPAPAIADSTADPEVIVVGAGLAGCLIGEALARRGRRVLLLERQAEAASETSGNLTAVMLPMLSLDDNRASRLNRACYLHALRTIREWRAHGSAIAGETCGVLQVGRDAAHESKQRDILARCGFPPAYVRHVDRQEASRLAGVDVAGPGWWFEGGAWWNPPSLCRAAIERAGAGLATRFGCEVERIAFDDDGWTAYDTAGSRIATAPQLVLATAHDLLRLPQTAHLPLFRFRGQVSHLPAADDAPLRCVVCKEGYVSPAWRGVHCVGASFHRGGDAAIRKEDHRANLDRLQSMLPGYRADVEPASLGGRVAFRPVSPDKLPIVGAMYRPDATPQGRDLSAVERWPGLSVASGYGARGLVWSVLMAELLASQITGEPLPIESELAATVDPARFLLRRKDA
jgi:tRNA 5-methylaminomethyl-2-thiouridine biosynthesis bifunctional protein